MACEKEKIAIIGSGNWGSVIAKVVGRNVQKYPDIFEEQVRMWVFEEVVDGKPLTEWINTQHENVKYLPGVPLPETVYADPNIESAIDQATILVFVIPHQFVNQVCNQIKGKVHPRAKAVSLIKGVDVNAKGLSLISDVISEQLHVDTSVLMGANIANEVAQEYFSESTLGYKNEANAKLLHKLFNTPYFKVSAVQDVAGVELCGALKNIVGIAAGLVDGLKYGDNTKAAVIRIGLMEMRKFAKMFYKGVNDESFFQSCGVADVITTCNGGRNRRVAEAHVLTGKSFDVLEKEMLNGQKLQGTLTAKEVYEILKVEGKTDEQVSSFYSSL